jgi:hypothetical protein
MTIIIQPHDNDFIKLSPDERWKFSSSLYQELMSSIIFINFKEIKKIKSKIVFAFF